MNKTAVVAISNLTARGAFTVPLRLGHDQLECHFVLDSGSSTFVVDGQHYQPHQDRYCQYTRLVQEVFYGLGGWYGPVVKTQVNAGYHHHNIQLPDTHLAVTQQAIPNTFGQANGILGLAYAELNHAYDISSLITQPVAQPACDGLYYEKANSLSGNLSCIKAQLQRLPKQQVQPYFSQLEQQGLITHQFALLLHRSSIYHCQSQHLTEHHPFNSGLFVMGSAKSHDYLHLPDYQAVEVLHDKYYNVSVIGLQIGNGAIIDAPELAPEQQKTHISNGIVDTGATHIALPQKMFETLLDELSRYHHDFAPLLAQYRRFNSTEIGLDSDQINLQQWPDMHLLLQGFDGKQVKLTLSPHVYWQINAPENGQLSFKFTYIPNWPNQCVLGLPLFCDHYTIFDRHEHRNGAVIFAPKTTKMADWSSLHHDHEHMADQFSQLKYVL